MTARPVKGILALLNMLLGIAAAIVKAGYLVLIHLLVGDDEAHAGQQLSRMSFDLGDDAALLVPGRSLALEVLVKAFDLGHRMPPSGPFQPMRDLLPQDAVRRQPGVIEIVRLFQPRIDRTDGTLCEL